MTKGSPTSLLLRFAMPLFLGNLLQQFYNLVDTSIAGNLLGDGALAQIGATAALYSLITNFAFVLDDVFVLLLLSCADCRFFDISKRTASGDADPG